MMERFNWDDKEHAKHFPKLQENKDKLKKVAEVKRSNGKTMDAIKNKKLYPKVEDVI